MENELADRLQRYLAGRYPGAQVTEFQFLASGYESDVYTFVFHAPQDSSRPLILRVYPGDHVNTKLLREANGLGLLQKAGFPVAAMVCFETDPGILGNPFTVMEKLTGKGLWALLDQVPPVQADHLLDRFGSLMAQLHRLDWRPFTPQPDRYEANPTLLLEEDLAGSRQWFQRFGVPGFEQVTDWLEAHKSEITVQLAVVHLDFNASNVFLCDDDRLVVIDWTQVTVHDYRADLSWTLMIMGDFGQPHWKERILQAYRQEAGHPIESLGYFNVIADTKILASTIISSQTSPAALGLNPGKGEAPEQQATTIRRLYQRIKQTTGVTIPEVEAALSDLIN